MVIPDLERRTACTRGTRRGKHRGGHRGRVGHRSRIRTLPQVQDGKRVGVAGDAVVAGVSTWRPELATASDCKHQYAHVYKHRRQVEHIISQRWSRYDVSAFAPWPEQILTCEMRTAGRTRGRSGWGSGRSARSPPRGLGGVRPPLPPQKKTRTPTPTPPHPETRACLWPEQIRRS